MTTKYRLILALPNKFKPLLLPTYKKDNSLQKMIEELTVEKAKVSELTQKIGVHNHDGSSSWIKLEQEEIFNAGEGGLENESFD